MGIVITYQGAELRIDVLRSSWHHTEYLVTLGQGQWPKDSDLITLCDDHGWTATEYTELPLARHFGGSVTPCLDTDATQPKKIVKVYED